jgi:hypothetical protein
VFHFTFILLGECFFFCFLFFVISVRVVFRQRIPRIYESIDLKYIVHKGLCEVSGRVLLGCDAASIFRMKTEAAWTSVT